MEFSIFNIIAYVFVGLLVLKFMPNQSKASSARETVIRSENISEVDNWRRNELESLYGKHFVKWKETCIDNDVLISGDIFENYANLFFDPELIKFDLPSRLEDKVSEFWIWRNRAHLSYQKVVNTFKARFTHNSLGLDGNSISEHAIEIMMDRDIIPTDKQISLSDVKQVIDHYDAITKLVEMVCTSFSSNIREEDVLLLHELLLHNSKVKKGYRDYNVVIYVEKIIFPQFQEVKGLMTKLFKYLNSEKFKKMHPITQACLVHYHFSRIQPFATGNGRMARIMMNYILLKNRYPFVSFPRDKKAEYWQAVQQMEVIVKNKKFDKKVDFCSMISKYAEEAISDGIHMLQQDFQQHSEL